jgi:hypothetical protein
MSAYRFDPPRAQAFFAHNTPSARLPAVACRDSGGLDGCTVEVAEGSQCPGCRSVLRAKARDARRAGIAAAHADHA